jgi:hypothetical protein
MATGGVVRFNKSVSEACDMTISCDEGPAILV